MTDEPPAPKTYPAIPSRVFKRAAIEAIAGAIVLVGLPYLISFVISHLSPEELKNWHDLRADYNLSLLFVLPFVQGFLGGYRIAPYADRVENGFGIFLLFFVVDIVIAMSVLKEGYICIIMASPLLFLVASMGLAAGCFVGSLGNGKFIRASVLPLLVLFVVWDTTSSLPNYADAVSDAVTIRASPASVWKYIVEYPENTSPPNYWLWKIGMPRPMASVAMAAKVGGERECRFSSGVVFKEKITELVAPKVLTFDVVGQPNDPEILGHFSFDKGQIYLEPNKDGSTTVIATSRYHLHVAPVFYFNWWAQDMIRKMHFRVLDHMKTLAEDDIASATKSN